MGQNGFYGVKDAVVSLKDKFISAFETIRKKVSSIVEKIKGFLQPLVDLFNKVKDGVASIGAKSRDSLWVTPVVMPPAPHTSQAVPPDQ